ncbi:MAG: hypothetical protein NC223_08805 [Butyrivibrio sp.]|nr:hypothetical protein [Butyrivibrio sp.]
MYFWIYYAVWILQAYALGMCIDVMLTPRIKNKYLSALVFTSALAFTSYFKLKTTETDMQTAYQLANVVSVLIMLYFVVLMHKDRMSLQIKSQAEICEL